MQRAAQQESRVEGRQRADLTAAGVERIPAPAGARNAVLDAEQRLHRRAAEAEQKVRVGELNLAADEGQADCGFLRGGRAVSRRPPRHDIGDVNAGAIKSDRRQHQIEELAGSPDKRPADHVFVVARRLANEHDAALRIAVGEYELRRGGAQRAALEFL